MSNRPSNRQSNRPSSVNNRTTDRTRYTTAPPQAYGLAAEPEGRPLTMIDRIRTLEFNMSRLSAAIANLTQPKRRPPPLNKQYKSVRPSSAR